MAVTHKSVIAFAKEFVKQIFVRLFGIFIIITVLTVYGYKRLKEWMEKPNDRKN